MEIIEVNTSKLAHEFLLLPVRLYRERPRLADGTANHWIRPLDKDIESVFDPARNKAFRHGACTRWILQKEGRTIGRVAAFFDRKKTLKDNDQPTGGMGFFECIEDKQAAFLLFDTCKNWLQGHGMEAMDGPVNFGERDKWWGLLVEGFGIDPNYQCNYNFPYYQAFFEEYGFQVYFKQFTYARKTNEPLSPRLQMKADKIARDPDYSFSHIRKSKLKKYAQDFLEVYNKAWARHAGVAKMSSLQANAIMKQLKPVMDERIIWFAYYKGEPVGFFINLPEVNQIFRHLDGKLDLIGKLKFLYHKWRKSCKKMFGLVFGIVPEHQGKGLDGALIMATRKLVQEDYPRYPEYEMNWIGDFNPLMIKVVEQVGASIAKVHITYRKLFDETKPFKRMPIK